MVEVRVDVSGEGAGVAELGMALGRPPGILIDGMIPGLLAEGRDTGKLTGGVLPDLLGEGDSPGIPGGMPLVSLMGGIKPGAWDED